MGSKTPHKLETDRLRSSRSHDEEDGRVVGTGLDTGPRRACPGAARGILVSRSRSLLAVSLAHKWSSKSWRTGSSTRRRRNSRRDLGVLVALRSDLPLSLADARSEGRRSPATGAGTPLEGPTADAGQNPLPIRLDQVWDGSIGSRSVRGGGTKSRRRSLSAVGRRAAAVMAGFLRHGIEPDAGEVEVAT